MDSESELWRSRARERVIKRKSKSVMEIVTLVAMV